MSRMSEIALEIRERTVARQTPAEIAKALGIPQHWVVEMIAENGYNDYMDRNASRHYYADDSADVDALNYGNR
jgi:hypothetical protein